MYGILLSAFSTVLGFVFREVVVKFLVFAALYAVILVVANNLSEFLVGNAICCTVRFDANGVAQVLALLPAGVWYFLQLAMFNEAICLLIAAFTYRFLIRRLPLIG